MIRGYEALKVRVAAYRMAVAAQLASLMTRGSAGDLA